jgi:hypothetical protein
MLIDMWMVYQFIRRLATPFTEWDAYKQGVIDTEGNLLKKRRDRLTRDEKISFGTFDLMVLKLKRMLEKLPGGSTRIASYAAALWLIKEYKHFSDSDSLLTESITDDQIDAAILCFSESYSDYITSSGLVKDKSDSIEEEIANSIGGGGIASFSSDTVSAVMNKVQHLRPRDHKPRETQTFKDLKKKLLRGHKSSE